MGLMCMCVYWHKAIKTALPASMCVCVFLQIYSCCLLCDWPRDSSGRPPRLPSSLSCQKGNQQRRCTRFTPRLPIGRVGKNRPGMDVPACVRCLSPPIPPSLSSGDRYVEITHSLRPREGWHPSLSSSASSFPHLSSSLHPSSHSTINCLSNWQAHPLYHSEALWPIGLYYI